MTQLHGVLRSVTVSRGGAPAMGGLPIREPVATCGPFVPNGKARLPQAVEDVQSGRVRPAVPYAGSDIL
ncbi:pirin-like C-terminal cupin domain-containing protein [Allosalinactinospora lopnorensis]|uniref:pirin-like C-terminal cupin domain-containing protein n=1 Tax=Allosalinactinospora lopnorensis TaxID=1352348 RepID=UPI0009E504A5|nr:pirin-like C-terminal cupin domain-containing protein [Allosalinactinospora lopnorensis]